MIMGSIGWSLWWAAVLTPLITQRGETMESSQSLCTAFMAWVEKAQHRDFGCTWPWVPEALFDLVTLGDYFTKNEMVSFITPWSQTAAPILSLRICAVAMRWSHPPKPNRQWTLPRAFSSFFFFFHFSQVEPKPPSKVSWLLTSTNKSSRKRWW